MKIFGIERRSESENMNSKSAPSGWQSGGQGLHELWSCYLGQKSEFVIEGCCLFGMCKFIFENW